MKSQRSQLTTSGTPNLHEERALDQTKAGTRGLRRSQQRVDPGSGDAQELNARACLSTLNYTHNVKRLPNLPCNTHAIVNPDLSKAIDGQRFLKVVDHVAGELYRKLETQESLCRRQVYDKHLMKRAFRLLRLRVMQ